MSMIVDIIYLFFIIGSLIEPIIITIKIIHNKGQKYLKFLIFNTSFIIYSLAELIIFESTKASVLFFISIFVMSITLSQYYLIKNLWVKMTK